MESFRALYLEYCKTYNIEPQECIKSELKRISIVNDETSFTFNLSNNHLTDKTCTILSKLLANDQNFKHLILNDCSISTDGIRDICHGLTTNNSIKTLELKGNNIHGDGTEYIAKVLRQNTSIKSLSLEWNSIGLMDTNAFPLFCESLSMNKSLKDLDLRNNQITHTSGLELCVAIQKNTCLQTLDLRWNSIGLVGGKGILSALKKNHTLTQLHLAGNNIPEDIVDAINLKMGFNNEQVKTVKDYNSRASVLVNELQSVQYQKEKQVNLLLNKIDLQEEAVRKTNRTMSEKMKKLQFALEDRMAHMNTLTSKLSITEADLALSEQKCSDLEHALQKMKLERENEINLINAKSKRDKEELIDEKGKLQLELSELNKRFNVLDDRNKDLERENRKLETIAFDAKEKMTYAKVDYERKKEALDQELKNLKLAHRDELKEYEQKKAIEINKIKDDAYTNEKNLKETIRKLEDDIKLQQDEIRNINLNRKSDKKYFEEQLNEMQKKYESQTKELNDDFESKLKRVKEEKSELLDKVAQTKAKEVDLSEKLKTEQLTNKSLKDNMNALRKKIEENEKDMIQVHEYKNEIIKLNAEIEGKKIQIEKLKQIYSKIINDFKLQMGNTIANLPSLNESLAE